MSCCRVAWPSCKIFMRSLRRVDFIPHLSKDLQSPLDLFVGDAERWRETQDARGGVVDEHPFVECSGCDISGDVGLEFRPDQKASSPDLCCRSEDVLQPRAQRSTGRLCARHEAL